MGRLLAPFLLLASISISASPRLKIPYSSVLPLATNGRNICTAFSINERKRYWLTAAHCHDNGVQTIAGVPAEIVARDDQDDLMIVTGPAAKALTLAPRSPIADTPVFKWGCGNGWEPWLSEGRIVAYFYFSPAFGHLVQVFDLLIKPGDSGSPIMTQDGQVVSVAEITFETATPVVAHPAGGLPTELLYALVEPFIH